MFKSAVKKELKAVPLNRKPDLSGNHDVGIVFSESMSALYFYVEGSNEIGKLSFDTLAYRGVRTDCSPYRDKESSFLLEVLGSDWPLMMDNWVYLPSRNESWFIESKKRIKHYVASGNDIYHEFLADGFTEEYIPADFGEYELATRILRAKP